MHDHHHHTHDHHGHCHHHGDISKMSEKRLWWAVGANMLLTVAQVIGGIVSGSLSLIADALHNFSDAASLFIALFAIRIGRRPADEFKTFGYKRAETIAALINLTTLILIGIYLVIEAVNRFITPEPVSGWMVVWVAGIALVVDLFTAMMTYSQSKNSMNMRAAFLHNLTDAMASVGVIISGALILLYGWIWTDAAMTIVIAAYVLWHGYQELPNVIHLLMQGTPPHIAIDDIIQAIKKTDGVKSVHHVHAWQIDEQKNALEAHIVYDETQDMNVIKNNIKNMLSHDFDIGHSTLEMETNTSCKTHDCAC